MAGARRLRCLSVISVLLVVGCSNSKYTPDSTGNRIRHHPEIHATFEFLPEHDKRDMSIIGNTVLVSRSDRDGVVVSHAWFTVSGVDSAVLDSLVYFAGRLEPGTYEKRGVLEGTKIWITAGGQTTICDNCLNDYVLRESGLKLARPPKKVEQIKVVVGLLNALAEHSPDKNAANRKRLEVITDISHLTDTTHKYRVNDLDKKK